MEEQELREWKKKEDQIKKLLSIYLYNFLGNNRKSLIFYRVP